LEFYSYFNSYELDQVQLESWEIKEVGEDYMNIQLHLKSPLEVSQG